MEQLERMGLKCVEGGFDALPKSEQIAETQAVIWVHHIDIDQDDIETAIDEQRWQGEVRRFKRDPRMLAALVEVPTVMERLRAMVDAKPAAPDRPHIERPVEYVAG